MEQTKSTVNEVADIIDMEGIGYAVHSYLSADDIEDETLAALWRSAAAALDAVELYVTYNETRDAATDQGDEEFD